MVKKDKLIPFEKSKRVIQLDRRGRDVKKNALMAKIFAVLGALCLIYCVAILLFVGYGNKFFLIWGAFAAAFGMMALVFQHQKWLECLPKWFKRCFVGCCAVGLLFLGIVEGMILSQFAATAQPGADYVIVLGAQWKTNGPSYVLQKRLDTALEYLRENPDTKVIVSGGQGDNEHISEAQGMYDYLLAAGIDEERIFMEDQSTNTYENLVFSSALLDKENDRVVLVTNNFHVFRAVKIAERQGYTAVEGLAAGSYPAMIPNNLLREFFGVIKDFWVGNL